MSDHNGPRITTWLVDHSHKLQRRHNLSLLMAQFIALLVVLAVILAIVAIQWGVINADESAAQREKQLLDQELVALLGAHKRENERFAVGDEAYQNAHVQYSSEWVHRNMGQKLAQSFEHDLTILLNASLDPLYTANEGFVWLPEIYEQKLKSILSPTLRELQQEFQFSTIKRNDGFLASTDTSDGMLKPHTRSFLIEFDGRPALTALTTVTPESYTIPILDRRPCTLISIRVLNADFLAKISRKLGLHNLTFVPNGSTVPFSAQKQLVDQSGNPFGSLSWSPNTPGQDLWQQAAPIVYLAFSIILAVLILALRRMSAASRKLFESEAQARHSSLHDSLSGLPNRDLFERDLKSVLTQCQQTGEHIAVVYLDLDYFKEVNDTLGHQVGDELIRAVADRLRRAVNDEDTVARISGDEFVILFRTCRDKIDLRERCQSVVETFKEPFDLGSHRLFVTCSMGAVRAPIDGVEPGELIRRADVALYKAKEAGRERCIVFEPSMEDKLRQRRQIEAELREALERNQFRLCYQPQVSPDGRHTITVEALLRWHHPLKGTIPPSFFVPIAEGCEMIWKIGEWVLRQACRDGLNWPDISIAVNVSPAQVRHPEFASQIKRILREENFPPHKLELEVTEAVLMDQSDAALNTIEELRLIGVKLALDDFGTGFSSLSYLRKFPFGKFKIDRSFITSVEHEVEAAAVVHTLVGLGEALGMEVTAEGVETPGQHRFLQASRCTSLQGFYFARPMLARDITRRLQNEQKRPDNRVSA
ncbi:MAG: EAL domain-containing protein [Stappiaceae bacterium]